MIEKRSSLVAFAASVSVVGLLVGCAAGSDPSEIAEANLATVPDDAGPAQEPVTMPAETDESDEESDAGAPAGDAGSGGGADAGGSGGGGGTPTNTCAAPNTCATSPSLGTVSGDKGADVLSATGTGSKWFRVQVTEDDSGVGGAALWMKATLTSPPGTNFDLFLYRGGSAVACTGVDASSASTSANDAASLEWGESGAFSNGGSDTAWVTVEVRHVSGACSPGASWSLSVLGNQI